MKTQQGISWISVIVLVFVVFLGGVVFLKSQEKKEQIPASINNSPVVETFIPELTFSIEDAINNKNTDTLILCNKALVDIDTRIGQINNLKFLDLSENSLNKLSEVIYQLKNLEELNLVGNYLSNEEIEKIKKAFPKTKLGISPQKDFDYAPNPTWPVFDNKKFKFRFHPDLKIDEKNGVVRVSNSLVDLKSTYLSCSAETGYIDLTFEVLDNPRGDDAFLYLEKLWETTINRRTYDVSLDDKQQKMIKYIKPYQNNNLVGLVAESGESEMPIVVVAYNKKYYIAKMRPGGQTGSRIGEVPRRVMENILSTFEFGD